jgi:hypothetical protein
MISILVEAQDVFTTNPIVLDLLTSFTHPNAEEKGILKIKKNRRKHLKDVGRYKRIGVIKRSCSTSDNQSRKNNVRKFSEKLAGDLFGIDSKIEAKRNSYNFRDFKRNSSNALLNIKRLPHTLNVSIEKSTDKKGSQHDQSNGDQGTRIDSPLLKNPPKKSISQDSIAKIDDKYNPNVTSFKAEHPMASTIKDLLKHHKSNKILDKKGLKKTSKVKLKKKKVRNEGNLLLKIAQ